MNDEKSYQEGFMFALLVLGNMGHRVDTDALAAKLHALKDGTDTLSDGPADTIRRIENEYGKPLPDSLKASVHKLLSNRKELDERNAKSARIILEMMGE